MKRVDIRQTASRLAQRDCFEVISYAVYSQVMAGKLVLIRSHINLKSNIENRRYRELK